MAQIDYSSFSSSKPIREITYEVLKDAIISGEIPSGERIVESEYAARFNISRTPVREALRKLEHDGLVEYLPRRGVVVKSLDESDIREIFAIRSALEMLAADHVVGNTTGEDTAFFRGITEQIAVATAAGDIEEAAKLSRVLHTSIYALSHMNRLVQMLKSLDEYMDRFSRVSLQDARRSQESAEEHATIIAALERRDTPAFKAILVQHLESALDNCLRAYEKQRMQTNGGRA